ncbi:hypothetical protein BDK51DRAFT_32919, partial [Blyttiomyces helicus]
KRRAGKWRSVEVFKAGRRNCSLSHFRMGSVPVEIKVAEVPTELQPEERRALAQACQKLHFSYSLSAHAVPEVIEFHPTSNDFRSTMAILNAQTFAIPRWLDTNVRPLSLRRYVVADWIPHGIARAPSAIDWRATLGFKSSSELDIVNRPPGAESWAFVPEDSELINYAIVDWDIRNGTVFIGSSGFHRVGITVMTFLSRAMARIRDDHRAMQSACQQLIPAINHVGMTTRLGPNKGSGLETQGFIPIDQYEVLRVGSDFHRSSFDSLLAQFDHAAVDQFGLFVAAMEDVFPEAGF